jgi:hypothetical protein
MKTKILIIPGLGDSGETPEIYFEKACKVLYHITTKHT